MFAGEDLVELIEAQDWTFPIPIAYGPGRLKEIGTMCSASDMTRPLIVTDRGSRDLPFVADLERYLRESGLTSDVYA